MHVYLIFSKRPLLSDFLLVEVFLCCVFLSPKQERIIGLVIHLGSKSPNRELTPKDAVLEFAVRAELLPLVANGPALPELSQLPPTLRTTSSRPIPCKIFIMLSPCFYVVMDNLPRKTP